jgi:hypothetical protein
MSVSLASSLVLLMMNSISSSVRGRAFVLVNQPAARRSALRRVEEVVTSSERSAG